MDNDCLVVIYKITFQIKIIRLERSKKHQLGPRYEGQLMSDGGA